MSDKTRNAASKEQIEKDKRREEVERVKKHNAINYVLSKVEGRKFYWDLMCDCGIFTVSAHNSGSWTYFNEGKRSVGLKLLKELNDFDPKVYALMVEENKGE